MASPSVHKWTIALALLCAACLWLRLQRIENTLPYPYDIDEGFITGPATRMIVTGTLHPYTFNYPSLPKYLAAIGMAEGFLRAAMHHEIRDLGQLGATGYPYYQTPRAVQGAKQLFALLSVLALSATGAAAWLAFQEPAAILLAPLALSLSQLFFYHSWAYLNVDIIGACFVVLALAACLQGTRHVSLSRSAVVPGILAGLATGSKYTLGVVIVPVLLGIGLHFPRGRKTLAALTAIAAMAAAFLAVVPYSLIDIPGFLNGVAAEAYHYSGGHPGFDADPGFAQLAYYGRHFVSEFGPPGIVIAVIGAVAHMRSDWRRAAVLISLPAMLLTLLASQRVHFERNVLSLHPVVAMYVAYGAIVIYRRATAYLARRGSGPGARRRLRIAVAVAVAIIAMPLWRLAAQARQPIDSRNAAREWMERRLPPEWTIVVPSQLGFDTRPLAARGSRVIVIDLQAAHDANGMKEMLSPIPRPAVVLLPRWGADSRFSGQEAAAALNDASRRWPTDRTFGTNPVLVNYSQPTPWGDPAFSIATLR